MGGGDSLLIAFREPLHVFGMGVSAGRKVGVLHDLLNNGSALVSVTSTPSAVESNSCLRRGSASASATALALGNATALSFRT